MGMMRLMTPIACIAAEGAVGASIEASRKAIVSLRTYKCRLLDAPVCPSFVTAYVATRGGGGTSCFEDDDGELLDIQSGVS
jgi:hypothetical protein